MKEPCSFFFLLNAIDISSLIKLMISQMKAETKYINLNILRMLAPEYFGNPLLSVHGDMLLLWDTLSWREHL